MRGHGHGIADPDSRNYGWPHEIDRIVACKIRQEIGNGGRLDEYRGCARIRRKGKQSFDGRADLLLSALEIKGLQTVAIEKPPFDGRISDECLDRPAAIESRDVIGQRAFRQRRGSHCGPILDQPPQHCRPVSRAYLVVERGGIDVSPFLCRLQRVRHIELPAVNSRCLPASTISSDEAITSGVYNEAKAYCGCGSAPGVMKSIPGSASPSKSNRVAFSQIDPLPHGVVQSVETQSGAQ